MNGDIPSEVMSLIDISDRPNDPMPLRDDGREPFDDGSDYDVRSANEDEIERSGLMRHPMLRAVRLSRVEDGEIRAIVFNVENYHVEAINQASDDFLEVVFETLAQRGFEPFSPA